MRPKWAIIARRVDLRQGRERVRDGSRKAETACGFGSRQPDRAKRGDARVGVSGIMEREMLTAPSKEGDKADRGN